MTPEFREDAPKAAAFAARIERIRARRESRIDTIGAVILGVVTIALIIIRLAL